MEIGVAGAQVPVPAQHVHKIKPVTFQQCCIGDDIGRTVCYQTYSEYFLSDYKSEYEY